MLSSSLRGQQDYETQLRLNCEVRKMWTEFQLEYLYNNLTLTTTNLDLMSDAQISPGQSTDYLVPCRIQFCFRAVSNRSVLLMETTSIFT